MVDLRQLIQCIHALTVVVFIQEKSSNIFGGMFTELFQHCRLALNQFHRLVDLSCVID